MSLDGVSLTLTSEQVETVLADVAARAEHCEPLPVAMSLSEPLASSLLEDRTVSRALVRGLMAYRCLPSDGSERELKEIAKELDLPPSTAYRYVHTLTLVGLIEKNPQSRKYHRVPTSQQGSQS
jgi:hypothetical protein